MLIWLLPIIGAATALSFRLSIASGFVTLFSSLLLVLVFIRFTKKRYARLAMLSDYLKRVNSGRYALDLPDNDEGELSILKSEIYKVTVSLRERGEMLEREKNRLSDALSDISHQFKTPLTSLRVLSDLLCEETLDAARRADFTAKLPAQLNRLTWLTDALLKLSKLDAKSVLFNMRPVALPLVIDKACEPLLIPMELKQQSLHITAEAEAYCDLNWTTEALGNILKNCMEHTPIGGTIVIDATANALFSQIRVIDQGPGIDAADLPYLFDRFYRGKHASADSVGIGLAMAMAIVQAQGGSITARNAPSVGAEFTLRLARQKGNESHS